MVDGKECYIKIVRDDGKRFIIDQDRWRVPNDGLENFGGVEYEVSTKDYAQYDGAALLNERVPTQDRSITCYPYFDYPEARKKATNFFIPRHSYEVHCTYMGRTRYFTGRQYAFEFTTGNVYARPYLKWTCLALEPMWLSEDSKSFNMAAATGYFGFPFISWNAGKWENHATEPYVRDDKDPDHIKGFVAGIISNRIDMANGGNAQAYPSFDIKASDPVVKPSVSIVDATGATVCTFGLDMTLEAGDEVIVDFAARPTSITCNGNNISHKITAGSTLASGIDVGDFTVIWDAASGDAAMSVVPTIRERYTSV